MQKANSQPASSKSSAPFFDPKSFATGCVEIVQALQEDFKTAAKRATREYQKRIRSEASSNESWAPFANNLYVTFDEKNNKVVVGVNGTDDLLDKIAEVEYGTGAVPPAPLYRKFTTESAQEVQLLVNKYSR
jgi:hypothetical protein